jgi:hypothetical protein
MAKSGNRVMKQKAEKAKAQARDAYKGRQLGMAVPEDYRKESVHVLERPSKEEREAQNEADAISRNKAAEELNAADKRAARTASGKTVKAKPLKIEEKDYKHKSNADHQSVLPVVEKKAKRRQAEKELGMGLSRVTRSGSIQPLVGTEKEKAQNILAANDKELLKGTAKRAAARDEKASRVDLTPNQKAERKQRQLDRFAKEKIEKASGKSVSLPAAESGTAAPGQAPKNRTTKPLKVKKTYNKKTGRTEVTSTGGAQVFPGDGKAGILDLGNVAPAVGAAPAVGSRREKQARRRQEYRIQKGVLSPEPKKSKNGRISKKERVRNNYAKQLEGNPAAAAAVNERKRSKIENTDKLARTRAGRIDAERDMLKSSLLKKATSMAPGTPGRAKLAETAFKLIQAPQKTKTIIEAIRSGEGDYALDSTVVHKDGSGINKKVTYRPGPKFSKVVGDVNNPDLTKTPKTVKADIGAPRLTEQVQAAGNHPVRLTGRKKDPVTGELRGTGRIELQTAKQVYETPQSIKGTVEDKKWHIQQNIRVKHEKGDSPIEPKYLNSYIKDFAQKNKLDRNTAVHVMRMAHLEHQSHAASGGKRGNPKPWETITSGALEHRKRRIGTETEIKERATAKQRMKKSEAKEQRGGVNNTKKVRAETLANKVLSKFTAVDDGSKKA